MFGLMYSDNAFVEINFEHEKQSKNLGKIKFFCVSYYDISDSNKSIGERSS